MDESNREIRFSLTPPPHPSTTSTSISTSSSSSVKTAVDQPGPGTAVGNDAMSDASSDFNQWLHAMKLVARLPGGMPPEFRRKLWLALADKYLKSKNVDWENEEEKCFCEKWREDDEELGIQIVKDLHRTGSSLCTGPAGTINQAKLKRILLGYARFNPAVGYCQGFNMLGALILQVMEKEETESIKVMIYLIEGILPAGYFSGSLGGLQADMGVFRELMTSKLPRLAKHLQKLQGPVENAFEPPLTNVFTMQWFLTMFCTCLPMTCVLRVWDLVLIEGSDVLLRTALVLWSLLEERILSARTADDFYCKMGSFSSELLNGHLIDSNGLIEKVVQLGPISDIQKLRDKHLYNVAPLRDNKGLQLYYSDEEAESDDDSRLAVATAFGLRLTRRGSSGLAPNNKSSDNNKDRIALDISLLKKQYDRLRERQRQAHIILTTAVARQAGANSSPSSSLPMNQLLMGRSAIVTNKGRRIGPPQGAIPPARKPSLPAIMQQQKMITGTMKKSLSGSASVSSLSSEKQEKHGETLYWRDTDMSKRRRDSLRWKDIKAETANISEERKKSQQNGDDSADSSRSNSPKPKSRKIRTRRHSDSSSYSDESGGNLSSSTDTSLCDEDETVATGGDVNNVSSLENSPMRKPKSSRKHSEVSGKKKNAEARKVEGGDSGGKKRTKASSSSSQIPFIQLMTTGSPAHSGIDCKTDEKRLSLPSQAFNLVAEKEEEDSTTECDRLTYDIIDEGDWSKAKDLPGTEGEITTATITTMQALQVQTEFLELPSEETANSVVITSTNQLSPIPDISSYMSTSSISPLPTPISYFDYSNLISSGGGESGDSADEAKQFNVNDEGVINEYFERVNSVERPTKLDLLYSLSEEDGIRNAHELSRNKPDDTHVKDSFVTSATDISTEQAKIKGEISTKDAEDKVEAGDVRSDVPDKDDTGSYPKEIRKKSVPTEVQSELSLDEDHSNVEFRKKQSSMDEDEDVVKDSSPIIAEAQSKLLSSQSQEENVEVENEIADAKSLEEIKKEVSSPIKNELTDGKENPILQRKMIEDVQISNTAGNSFKQSEATLIETKSVDVSSKVANDTVQSPIKSKMQGEDKVNLENEKQSLSSNELNDSLEKEGPESKLEETKSSIPSENNKTPQEPNHPTSHIASTEELEKRFHKLERQFSSSAQDAKVSSVESNDTLLEKENPKSSDSALFDKKESGNLTESSNRKESPLIKSVAKINKVRSISIASTEELEKRFHLLEREFITSTQKGEGKSTQEDPKDIDKMHKAFDFIKPANKNGFDPKFERTRLSEGDISNKALDKVKKRPLSIASTADLEKRFYTLERQLSLRHEKTDILSEAIDDPVNAKERKVIVNRKKVSITNDQDSNEKSTTVSNTDLHATSGDKDDLKIESISTDEKESPDLQEDSIKVLNETQTAKEFEKKISAKIPTTEELETRFKALEEGMSVQSPTLNKTMASKTLESDSERTSRMDVKKVEDGAIQNATKTKDAPPEKHEMIEDAITDSAKSSSAPKNYLNNKSRNSISEDKETPLESSKNEQSKKDVEPENKSPDLKNEETYLNSSLNNQPEALLEKENSSGLKNTNSLEKKELDLEKEEITDKTSAEPQIEKSNSLEGKAFRSSPDLEKKMNPPSTSSKSDDTSTAAILKEQPSMTLEGNEVKADQKEECGTRKGSVEKNSEEGGARAIERQGSLASLKSKVDSEGKVDKKEECGTRKGSVEESSEEDGTRAIERQSSLASLKSSVNSKAKVNQNEECEARKGFVEDSSEKEKTRAVESQGSLEILKSGVGSEGKVDQKEESNSLQSETIKDSVKETLVLDRQISPESLKPSCNNNAKFDQEEETTSLESGTRKNSVVDSQKKQDAEILERQDSSSSLEPKSKNESKIGKKEESGIRKGSLEENAKKKGEKVLERQLSSSSLEPKGKSESKVAQAEEGKEGRKGSVVESSKEQGAKILERQPSTSGLEPKGKNESKIDEKKKSETRKGSKKETLKKQVGKVLERQHSSSSLEPKNMNGLKVAPKEESNSQDNKVTKKQDAEILETQLSSSSLEPKSKNESKVNQKEESEARKGSVEKSSKEQGPKILKRQLSTSCLEPKSKNESKVDQKEQSNSLESETKKEPVEESSKTRCALKKQPISESLKPSSDNEARVDKTEESKSLESETRKRSVEDISKKQGAKVLEGQLCSSSLDSKGKNESKVDLKEESKSPESETKKGSVEENSKKPVLKSQLSSSNLEPKSKNEPMVDQKEESNSLESRTRKRSVKDSSKKEGVEVLEGQLSSSSLEPKSKNERNEKEENNSSKSETRKGSVEEISTKPGAQEETDQSTAESKKMEAQCEAAIKQSYCSSNETIALECENIKDEDGIQNKQESSVTVISDKDNLQENQLSKTTEDPTCVLAEDKDEPLQTKKVRKLTRSSTEEIEIRYQALEKHMSQSNSDLPIGLRTCHKERYIIVKLQEKYEPEPPIVCKKEDDIIAKLQEKYEPSKSPEEESNGDGRSSKKLSTNALGHRLKDLERRHTIDGRRIAVIVDGSDAVTIKKKSNLPSTKDLELRFNELERQLSSTSLRKFSKKEPNSNLDQKQKDRGKANAVGKKSSVKFKDAETLPKSSNNYMEPPEGRPHKLPTTKDLEIRFDALERQLSSKNLKLNLQSETLPNKIRSQEDCPTIETSKEQSTTRSEKRPSPITAINAQTPEATTPTRRRIPSTEDLELRFEALEKSRNLKSPSKTGSISLTERSILEPVEHDFSEQGQRRLSIPSIEELENRFHALEQNRKDGRSERNEPTTPTKRIPSTEDLELRMRALDDLKNSPPKRKACDSSLQGESAGKNKSSPPSTEVLEARFKALEQTKTLGEPRKHDKSPKGVEDSREKHRCEDCKQQQQQKVTSHPAKTIHPRSALSETSKKEIPVKEASAKKVTIITEEIKPPIHPLETLLLPSPQKEIPSFEDLDDRVRVMEKIKKKRESQKMIPSVEELHNRLLALERTLSEEKSVATKDGTNGKAMKSAAALDIKKSSAVVPEIKPPIHILETLVASPPQRNIPSVEDLDNRFEALDIPTSLKTTPTSPRREELGYSFEAISRPVSPWSRPLSPRSPSIDRTGKRRIDSFENRSITGSQGDLKNIDSRSRSSSPKPSGSPNGLTIEAREDRSLLIREKSFSMDDCKPSMTTTNNDSTRPTSCPEARENLLHDKMTTTTTTVDHHSDRVLRVIQENSKILHRILKKTLADSTNPHGDSDGATLLADLSGFLVNGPSHKGEAGLNLGKTLAPLVRTGTHTGIPLRTDDNINDRLNSIKNTIKSIDTLCEEKGYRKDKCQRYIDSLFAAASTSTPVRFPATKSESQAPSIQVIDFSYGSGTGSIKRSGSGSRSSSCSPKHALESTTIRSMESTTSPSHRPSYRDLRRDTSPRRRQRDEEREEYESRVRRDNMMPMTKTSPSKTSDSSCRNQFYSSRLDSELDAIYRDDDDDVEKSRSSSRSRSGSRSPYGGGNILNSRTTALDMNRPVSPYRQPSTYATYEPPKRLTTPAVYVPTKLEIRHTTVTSTFYDRYLTQKQIERNFPRTAGKSPVVSPSMTTKSYLDISTASTTPLSKSAETSPSRSRQKDDTNLFAYRQLSESGSVSSGAATTPTGDKHKLPLFKLQAESDRHIRSCDNILMQLRSSNNTTDLITQTRPTRDTTATSMFATGATATTTMPQAIMKKPPESGIHLDLYKSTNLNNNDLSKS